MNTTTKDALELARENYSSYGRYIAMGRSYPQIYDGCIALIVEQFMACGRINLQKCTM